MGVGFSTEPLTVVEEAVVTKSALLYLYCILRGIFSTGLLSSKYRLYRPRHFRTGKAMSPIFNSRNLISHEY